MAKSKIRRRCIKPDRTPIRVSKEFKRLINEIKARYLLAGRTPPSGTKITQMIAKKLKKEGLLRNEFIRI